MQSSAAGQLPPRWIVSGQDTETAKTLILLATASCQGKDRFRDTVVDAGEGARRDRRRPARPAHERKPSVANVTCGGASSEGVGGPPLRHLRRTLARRREMRRPGICGRASQGRSPRIWWQPPARIGSALPIACTAGTSRRPPLNDQHRPAVALLNRINALSRRPWVTDIIMREIVDCSCAHDDRTGQLRRLRRSSPDATPLVAAVDETSLVTGVTEVRLTVRTGLCAMTCPRSNIP
jgi:hypothetical protein